ncbi:MAG: indolepyruvate oxidoreductase subunit beta [Chloroflexi bacterium]|nr:indolepyruvate oxidoreductase subunit beta [Chloroflexota bacterium]
MQEVINLLFVGVGGQGSLLIAELTSLAAVQAGFDVKQTEVHGVSQRGGSVETHVRFGARVHSPIITPGEARVVIALEKLEALRFAHFAHPQNGELLINDFEIVPSSVLNAAELYPYDAFDVLRSRGYSLTVLPASDTAHQLGDGRMANVVLLGALSTLLPIDAATWQKTLQMRIPPRYLAGNGSAFQAGQQFMADRQPAAT